MLGSKVYVCRSFNADISGLTVASWSGLRTSVSSALKLFSGGLSMDCAIDTPKGRSLFKQEMARDKYM